jgi:hypothetical protein
VSPRRVPSTLPIKSEECSEQEEGGKQPRRRRSRNSKQQELNRLAQQRYR